MSSSAPDLSVHDASVSVPYTDIIPVEAGRTQISCDGGGGASGHPQIWLTLIYDTKSNETLAICPYCSRQFVAETQK